MRRVILLFVIIFLQRIAYSQSGYENVFDKNNVIELNGNILKTHISKYVSYLKDVDKKLSIYDVQAPRILARFVKSEMDVLNFKLSTDWYWIRIELENNAPDAKWLLAIEEAKIKFADLYFLNEAERWHVIKNGYAVPLSEKYKAHYFQVFPLSFNTKHAVFFLHVKGNLNPIPLTLVSNNEFETFSRSGHIISGLFLGFLLFIIFNNILVSLITRNATYLLYALTVAFYLLMIISTDGYFKLITDAELITVFCFCAFGAVFMAVLYGRIFLRIRHNQFVGKIIDLYLIVMMLGFTTTFFIWPSNLYFVIQIIGVSVNILMIIMASLSIRSEGRFARLYLLASIFLAVFVCLEVMHIHTGQPDYFFLIHGEWGILCEVIILNYALNLRSGFEREQLQHAKELAQAEALKQVQEKADFEQKIHLLELTTLRSQINPHFIFNSLNAINNFVIKAKATGASEYIGKFARLMRLTLENSREHKVELRRELEILNLYLQMEQLRYDRKFDYKIEVHPQVDLQTEIPSMMIQPYIENSIWHGLLQKPERGLITVTIEYVNGYLKCVVEDDGVGRKNKSSLAMSQLKDQKSLGMKITADRLATLNYAFKENSYIEIVDLQKENKEPTGTQVILMLQCD